MHLHASPTLPQGQPIPPRKPPAAEQIDGRKAARFSDVMNVADRPVADIQRRYLGIYKRTCTRLVSGTPSGSSSEQRCGAYQARAKQAEDDLRPRGAS